MKQSSIYLNFDFILQHFVRISTTQTKYMPYHYIIFQVSALWNILKVKFPFSHAKNTVQVFATTIC